MGLLRSRRVLYLFLGLYAVTLLLLIPGKPLWVDEIIDLGGVRNADLNGVLAFVPGNAGGVPLGYLVDFWMIRLFGYSVFVVRLPSVLFTVLTCVGVYILAKQTRLRMPLLAVILYAISPLNLRYALEARPYAQAACWSVFSTVVFLSLIRQPTFAKAAGYGALVAAGIFTQPYSIFVPVAHLIWLLFTRSVQEKSRTILLAGTAVALASLAFLPWFFKAHAAWQGAVSSGVRFVVTGKDLLVIPHELMGTGFIGAALTGIAIVVALGWSSWYKDEKIFWAHYAAIPLLLVPAGCLLWVLSGCAPNDLRAGSDQRASDRVRGSSVGLADSRRAVYRDGLRRRPLDPASGRRLAGGCSPTKRGRLLDVCPGRRADHVCLLRTAAPRMR